MPGLIDPSKLVIARATHESGGEELHEAADCPRDHTCPVYLAFAPPVTDEEIMACVRSRRSDYTDTCFIFDPENQYSTRQALERGEEFSTWYILNGTSLTWAGGSSPLSSEIAACPKHDALLSR